MSATAAVLDSFPATLARAWTWIHRVFWTALMVVGAMLVLQAVQLYGILAAVHPVLAQAVTLVLGAGLLAWCGWLFAGYLRTPRVLTPPELPPPSEGWSAAQQKQYRNFTVRYLKRQQRNPHLDDEARALIPAALERLSQPLPAELAADPVGAATELTRRADGELTQILESLDRQAKALIRRAAVEVSLATAVSPSVLLDSLIALARNMDLITKIATLYYGRPGLLGTLRVVRDVLGAAVAAGALEILSDNVAGAVTEMTGAWSARIIGPVGQGMVNGVVTMRLGAAAQQRCRSLSGRKVPWLPWRLANYRRAVSALLDWLAEDAGPWILGPMARVVRWTGKATQATVSGGAGLFGAVRKRVKKTFGGKGEPPAEDDNLPGDPVLDGDLLD